VVGAGYALSVGGTRDGGALALTLFHPTGPTKRYCADGEALGIALDDLHAYCTAAIEAEGL
jgi:hypothetical protein